MIPDTIIANVQTFPLERKEHGYYYYYYFFFYAKINNIIIIIINIIIIIIIIVIIIIIIIISRKRLHAVYKLQKDVCHNLWRAQTALTHYTRGPAE